MTVTGERDLDAPPRQRLRLIHWWIIGLLGLIEVVSAVSLAHFNPVAGWDEHAYLRCVRHLEGAAQVEYAHHRPPLFPLMLLMMGEHYRLLPAAVHIGATVLFFLILRRLTSAAVAIAGAAVLMISGDLRYFNILVMTEGVSVFCLLAMVLLFLRNRPLLVGVVGGLLCVLHWQMLTVLPAVIAVYGIIGRRRECVLVVGGAALTLTPFLIASAVVYGNPLHPVVANAALNTVGQPGLENDVWYYMRALFRAHFPLVAGGLVAVYWLATQRSGRSCDVRYGVCALAVCMVLALLMPPHVTIMKDARYLVPLIPLLLLLSILMVQHYGRAAPWNRYVAWPVLVVSVIAVMPGRNLLWEINDLVQDPANQVVALRDAVAAFDQTEVIYTEINDTTVMGHTGHATVAVTGAITNHRYLRDRPQCTRDEVPDDALYLTWNPGDGVILASAGGNRRGTLYLVRWRSAVPVGGETAASPQRSSSPALARLERPAPGAPR